MNMALLQTNFPLELKVKPIWMGYKLVEKKAGEKPSKVPIDPHTGYYGSSTDAAKHTDFLAALAAANKFACDGVGFSFAPPLVGIDLDHCLIDGRINDYARQIIDKVNSYTEISPSGDGVHIICKGVITAALKTKELEVYQNGRFFTATGNRISKHSLVREIEDLSFLYPSEYSGKRLTLREKMQNVQEGNRNNGLMSLAGSLRAKGYTPDEIYELLLPKAREVQLDEKELIALCNSVGRYAPKNISANGSSIEEFLRDEEKVEWIVPGIFAKKSIAFVAGLPETLKTWSLIDLAIECAKEKDGLWLGRFPVNHAKVLFIDQERFKGETQRRFRSVLSAKTLDNMTSVRDSLFIKSGTSIRLDLHHSFDAFKKELTDLRPDLVIIDSFATIKTVDENNRMEIQKVLEAVKELRNEFNCTFIFIHHESKMAYSQDAGEPSIAQMAGSVAIPAAAETVLTVRKQGPNTSMFYNTKNTLANTVSPFLVEVKDLDIDKSKIGVYTI